MPSLIRPAATVSVAFWFDVAVALHPERRVGQVVRLQRVAATLHQDGRRCVGLAVTSEGAVEEVARPGDRAAGRIIGPR